MADKKEEKKKEEEKAGEQLDYMQVKFKGMPLIAKKPEPRPR